MEISISTLRAWYKAIEISNADQNMILATQDEEENKNEKFLQVLFCIILLSSTTFFYI